MSFGLAPRSRGLVALTALGLLVGACVTVPNTTDPTLESSASASPRVGQGEASPDAGPATASDLSIGYIGLDDGIPYLSSVSNGIRAAAASAGVRLADCDSGWTREGALACATELAAAGIDGLISFQAFDDASTEICATVGEIPTLGIVFDQGPCQVSLLDIDQAESGRLAGEAVGRFAEERWQCDVRAFVSLESGSPAADGRARMQGYRDGFEERCALPEALYLLDGADRLATAQKAIDDLLVDLDGARIVVVGLNEDAILGAMAAAASAGREADLWYSGQLADPSIRQTIACDEHYIASVAQFPERFGELLVPALVATLEGQVVAAVMEAPLALVDATNIRDLYPDTLACGA